MRCAAEEGWDVAVHDCCNRTKFARDLNLRTKEGGWFGASSLRLRIRAPALRGVSAHPARPAICQFLEEEPLPEGYRPGDIVL